MSSTTTRRCPSRITNRASWVASQSSFVRFVRLLVRLGYYQNSWRVALSLLRLLSLLPSPLRLSAIGLQVIVTNSQPTALPFSHSLVWSINGRHTHAHTHTPYTRISKSVIWGKRARKTKSNLWHLFSVSSFIPSQTVWPCSGYVSLLFSLDFSHARNRFTPISHIIIKGTHRRAGV